MECLTLLDIWQNEEAEARVFCGGSRGAGGEAGDGQVGASGGAVRATRPVQRPSIRHDSCHR